MTVKTTNSSTVAPQKQYKIGSVTSKDGTVIGYYQYGHGPGIVVLHGMMSSAHNHKQLAEALADTFTVYVPDRRGRGSSGSYRHDYSIQQEVEDLEAILSQSGAQYVFGVSAGAIICLQAALTLPSIEKMAIFEPPFFIDDSTKPKSALTHFDREMAQGKVATALVTAMKKGQLGPYFMPRWLLTFMTKMMLFYEAKRGSGDYVPMRELASTLHYDFELVVEMNDKVENFKTIASKVLLLGSSKSPAYMKAALDALENLLPSTERIELPGLDHAASWNADRGGNPIPVAQELRRFFGS